MSNDKTKGSRMRQALNSTLAPSLVPAVVLRRAISSLLAGPAIVCPVERGKITAAVGRLDVRIGAFDATVSRLVETAEDVEKATADAMADLSPDVRAAVQAGLGGAGRALATADAMARAQGVEVAPGGGGPKVVIAS